METKKISLSASEAILFIIAVALTAWWATLFFYFKSSFLHSNLIWAASYQLAALWGAVCGLRISSSWGGLRSLIGRTIFVFSVGLLLQNLGQTVFSFYNLFLKTELPYPSIADIGFLGSVIFYIYGAVLLGQVCGIKLSLKAYHNKAIAFVIPLIILISSYVFFLRNYVFDFSNPVRVFLDFGYPLGEATYLSLAILAFLLSKDYLGGIMRGTMLFIILALFLQYVAEFNFLFQAGNSSWLNGGYGDFLYFVSYTFMSFSLIKFGVVFNKINNR